MATQTQAPVVRAPNALNQKPRTEGEERAAWVRRIRRWKRKALLVLGDKEVSAILKEVSALSAADVAGDK